MNINLVKGFLDGLKPTERISVSEWADKYRVLSSVASAEPGRWRTSRTPYLYEPMTKLTESDPAEEIIFMKGAQIGLTELGINWIGYIIHITPAPTLIVWPTDEMAKKNSKMRIDTMIEKCEPLRERIAPARSRDSNNTILQKQFPGGMLIMTGANAGTGLRSMPIKWLFLDEVDAMPQDVEGEGSPIELAITRTRTFAKRKVFICSTPTIAGESIIESRFLMTDQRYYNIPCPHCSHYQPLKFENLRWTKGQPETVLYFCENCGAGFEEKHKPDFLSKGIWKATVQDTSGGKRIGYHLSSLYSPYGWYSWRNIVEDFEKAQGDVPLTKTFVNTVLGQTYAEKGEAPPWENLYNRRESYKIGSVNRNVAFITCGVDVQKDRLELEIVGWAKGKISYSIDYRVLLGDTSNMAVWDELGKVVNEQFEREDNLLLPIRLMAVDTGYNTSNVYDFCRKYSHTQVIPVKGKDTQSVIVAPPRAVDTSKSGKKIGQLKVWNVGVSILKSELYGWLNLEKDENGKEPNGYCHFPQYENNYFRGITAEQLEFKVVKGFRKYQWVKKYERNEPLDCRNYARAAASVIGIDRFNERQWNELLNSYEARKQIQSQQTVRKNNNSMWDRHGSIWD